jgi:hypothetical protein
MPSRNAGEMRCRSLYEECTLWRQFSLTRSSKGFGRHRAVTVRGLWYLDDHPNQVESDRSPDIAEEHDLFREPVSSLLAHAPGSHTPVGVGMLRTVSSLAAAVAFSLTGGRRPAVCWTLAVCVVYVALAAPLRAQSIVSTLALRQPAGSVARTAGSTIVTRMKSGTAFFVDDLGHMLTARHVADNCLRVVVAKEGHVVAAGVVALSSELDIALLKVPKTLGLSAVFPHSVTVAGNDMMFAAAYDTLPRMTGHGGTLGNATVVSSGSEAGYLAIDSNVTFGSSGAPVLDGRGLVQGVISGRVGEVTAYSAPIGEMSMSRLKVASDRVLAVTAARAKAFLAANGIAVVEDDRPQIDPSSSRANRAASTSARVTCLQN